MNTYRVNRPMEAANILIRLSRIAFTMSVILWVMLAIVLSIGLWAYGILTVCITVAFSGVLAVACYWVTLHVLVERWQHIQFYSPTPSKRHRKIPVTTNGKTEFIDI